MRLSVCLYLHNLYVPVLVFVPLVIVFVPLLRLCLRFHAPVNVRA